jgi:hypothetical protein
MLSVTGPKPKRTDHWQTLRLFLMPFCVSSFSSLIKDKGYVLIVPPTLFELGISISCCLAFVLLVVAFKYHARTLSTQ